MRRREPGNRRSEKIKSTKNNLVYKRTEIDEQKDVKSGKIFNYLIIASVIGLLYLAFFSGAFKVSEIRVLGTRDISPDSIKELTKSKLEKQLFKNNLLVFDTDTVAHEIRKAHSLKKLKVTKHYPDKIEIEVDEYVSELQWATNNKYYLVDEKGRVVGEFLESKKEFPVIYDKKNLGVQIGKSLVTTDFINFIKYLNQNFSQVKNSKITKIEVNESFNEISVYTDLGFYIVMDTTRDPAAELKNVVTALDSKEIKSIKKLTYLDMRIKNRVYYK